jgi:hypothetical protein
LVSSIYSGAKWAFIFGTLFELFRALGNVVATTAQHGKKMKNLIYPYMIGAGILFVGLTVIGKVLWDIYVGLFYMMISSIIVFIAIYKMMNRLIPIKIDFKRWIFSIIVILGSLIYSYYSKNDNISNSQAIVVLNIVFLLVTLAIYILIRNNYGFHKLINLKDSRKG